MAQTKAVATPERKPKRKVCPCCGQFIPTKTFSEADLSVELTPRQLQIIRMIAEGNTAQESADLLKVSRRTIEFHRFMLMNKLRINTTAELTLYAAARGLI